ncbi:MAG TPA: 4Fe-4S dicluster domain-containing protein [Candidatus Bathyarchaeia archaeon]|nr:4Fe-4S dicluster domain-containing protein [Candidatus Bathyarchaeia archaeon]
MGNKTKIKIDYSICGDGYKVDPRNCGKCLRICPPALFLLHQTLGVEQKNPYDPEVWRITPLYPSLCTRCLECVGICPEKAITITW